MDHPDLSRAGLALAHAALSADQQADCLAQIYAAPWRTDLARRTQHYGFVYDYRARSVGPDTYLGPLPDWLIALGEQIACALPDAPRRWEQAIVNEYRPGVGIGEHADSRAFGPAVATVSLGGPTVMKFRPRYHAATFIPVRLEPGDVLLMTGPARSVWTHEIVGADVPRERVSITFRTVGLG